MALNPRLYRWFFAALMALMFALPAVAQKVDMIYYPINVVGTVILRDSTDRTSRLLERSCSAKTWMESAQGIYDPTYYTQYNQLYAQFGFPNGRIAAGYGAHMAGEWAVMGFDVVCKTESGIVSDGPVYYYATPYACLYPVVFAHFRTVVNDTKKVVRKYEYVQQP